MTTLGVITDVHTNLPALDAALAALEDAGCDEIVHLGDTVGIGPHPRECLERLQTLPNARFVMGNHDDWLAHGLPHPRPEWMTPGEYVHQQWTHAQVPDDLREWVATWPWGIDIELGSGPRVHCCHYARPASGEGFASVVWNPVPADLDRLFGEVSADVVFYGHHHPRSDLQGIRRYVNPGALGCHTVPEARYAIVTLRDGEQPAVIFGAAPYDWTPVFAAFESRSVPARDVIRRIFFGQP